MRSKWIAVIVCFVVLHVKPNANAGKSNAAPPQSQTQTAADPAKILIDRLDLARYKATIKGLTQFGDRRQGTDRNRKAIDWIEAQLKSYGCTNTERIKYDYQPPPRTGAGGARRPPADPSVGPGGSRRRGYSIPEGVN